MFAATWSLLKNDMINY